MSIFPRTGSRRDDLGVLWHLLARPVRGSSHADRMENFYHGQAANYDSFRSRLLHGRTKLISSIEFPADGVWVDLGAGTGENVVQAGCRAHTLREIHLVDLSSSLLDVAAKRVSTNQLRNTHIHLADATDFSVRDESVDVVTFSYSLTMIPDWFEAIAAAERMLKPGGVLATTDFYVSRKYASTNQVQHGWLSRAFWTHWFAADNVFLSADHLAMLQRRFITVRCEESRGSVPYLPLLRAPYYLFVGRKPNGRLSTPMSTSSTQKHRWESNETCKR